MTHRKRSRKELKAIHSKKAKSRPYRVEPLGGTKDEPNFLAGSRPSPIGGTRGLFGSDTIAENKTPIRSGKHPLARQRRLLKGADE